MINKLKMKLHIDIEKFIKDLIEFDAMLREIDDDEIIDISFFDD